MSVLGATSLGSQDANGMDRWILLSGFSLVIDGDVPGDSHAVRSIRNSGNSSPSSVWRPWLTPAGTAKEPSSTNVRIHARWKIDTLDAAQVNAQIGTARDGVEQISLSFTAATGAYTIRVAGTVVFTSVHIPGILAWNRAILDIDQQSGGLVRAMDSDGVTVLASYTLTGTDITNLGAVKPNGFWLGISKNNNNYTDFIAQDPSDADGSVSIQELGGASVLAVVPTGNSATDTGGTGSFTDVDEIPFSDADGIIFGAAALRRGFTMPALPANTIPLAVIPAFRIVRTGSAAGVNIQHTLRDGGGVLDGGVIPAPGSGFTERIFNTDRSGATWTKVAYDATENGIITVV